MDQLSGLRRLAAQAALHHHSRSAREGKQLITWAVGSGKGGVGKTLLSAAISLLVSRRGRRVLLVDGAFQTPNLHVLFGIRKSPSREAIISGRVGFEDAAVPISRTLRLLAPAHPETLSDEYAAEFVNKTIAAAAGKFDLVLFDMDNGFGALHRSLCSIADQLSLIVTGDPAAIINTYALLKLASLVNPAQRIDIIVNRARDAGRARSSFAMLAQTAAHFLELSLPYRGCCLESPEIEPLVQESAPLDRWPEHLEFFHSVAPLLPGDDFFDEQGTDAALAPQQPQPEPGLMERVLHGF